MSYTELKNIDTVIYQGEKEFDLRGAVSSFLHKSCESLRFDEKITEEEKKVVCIKV